MNTKIVKLNPLNPEPKFLKEAAQVLKGGGLVIIPTETVYGIAANMLNKKALDRLYEIKKRPKDKPFSLHIDEKGKVEKFATEIPVSAYKLIDKFWPGPLTVILKSKNQSTVGTSISLSANGERSPESLDFARDGSRDGEFVEPLAEGRIRTIGLRMPDNEIALRVIAQADVPVVCPSANISGNPAPVKFEEAIRDLDGTADFAIDAGNTKLGVESSIVDLTIQPPQILRVGAIKKEDIEAVVKKKIVLFVCTGNSCRSVMAKALLEKAMKEKNRDAIEVLSAGIILLSGLGATESTKEVLRREGLDVSKHRSQRVTRDMIRKSDIILVMEKLHGEKILELSPEAKFRLFLLKEFAKIEDNNLDISDPIGRPIGFYEMTLGIIKEAVEKISNII